MQRVTFPEPIPRISGLWVDVHADDVEAGALVTDGGAAHAAVEIEDDWLVHSSTIADFYVRSSLETFTIRYVVVVCMSPLTCRRVGSWPISSAACLST